MRIKNFLIILTFLILLGCKESAVEIIESKPVDEIKISDSPIHAKKPIDSTYGEYNRNMASMPINDYFFKWNQKSKELKIVYTPTKLSTKERERLENGEDEFMVLYNKKSPSEEIWQWYPYIQTKIHFKSDIISSENIKYLYVYASGIEKENSNDNINMYPNKEVFIDKVQILDGKLTLKYQGNTDLNEDKHSWSISI